MSYVTEPKCLHGLPWHSCTEVSPTTGTTCPGRREKPENEKKAKR